jgi:hypothetical protein
MEWLPGRFAIDRLLAGTFSASDRHSPYRVLAPASGNLADR